MRWVLAAGGAAAVVFALHRGATYAADRGWIYYRNGPKRGNTLGLFEEVFVPEIEYMVEEVQSEEIRADEAETGQEASPQTNRPGR